MIYLLHSRALCGGDMTDFRALPRDAEEGRVRGGIASPGMSGSVCAAFCGRVIFGGKI